MIRPAASVVLIAALGLTACGKVGALDQPAPLYGEKAKAQYQAEQAAAAAARAQKDNGPPDPINPDKTYNPYADPGPQRAQPIQGQNPSPSGGAAPGVLPDPFARPQ
jgi:hypothetical protein